MKSTTHNARPETKKKDMHERERETRSKSTKLRKQALSYKLTSSFRYEEV